MKLTVLFHIVDLQTPTTTTSRRHTDIADLLTLPLSELFAKILKSPRALEAFTEHLIREYAIENIQIYTEIQDLLDFVGENGGDMERINEKALAIFTDFVVEGSVRQV